MGLPVIKNTLSDPLIPKRRAFTEVNPWIWLDPGIIVPEDLDLSPD